MKGAGWKDFKLQTSNQMHERNWSLLPRAGYDLIQYDLISLAFIPLCCKTNYVIWGKTIWKIYSNFSTGHFGSFWHVWICTYSDHQFINFKIGPNSSVTTQFKIICLLYIKYLWPLGQLVAVPVLVLVPIRKIIYILKYFISSERFCFYSKGRQL